MAKNLWDERAKATECNTNVLKTWKHSFEQNDNDTFFLFDKLKFSAEPAVFPKALGWPADCSTDLGELPTVLQ